MAVPQPSLPAKPHTAQAEAYLPGHRNLGNRDLFLTSCRRLQEPFFAAVRSLQGEDYIESKAFISSEIKGHIES